MLNSQIQLVDRQTEQSFPAAPEGTVLSSSATLGWRGITVELHTLPPIEYPEHYVQGHRLAVVHRGKPITYEWKAGGRWQRRPTHPGIFFLQSHGDVNAPRWFEPFETVAIALDPTFIAHSFQDEINPDHLRLQECRAVFDPMMAQFAAQFEEELRNGCYGGALYGESLALAFSLYLLEHYRDRPQKLRRPSGTLTSLQLRQVVEYVHEHLTQDLSLEEIAAQMNLSAFHFARLFKHSLGLSPHQYVLQNRIDRAKKLIVIATNPNLTEIGLQVGFYDQAHFTKAFKRVVGVSPKGFYKQQIQPFSGQSGTVTAMSEPALNILHDT